DQVLTRSMISDNCSASVGVIIPLMAQFPSAASKIAASSIRTLPLALTISLPKDQRQRGRKAKGHSTFRRVAAEFAEASAEFPTRGAVHPADGVTLVELEVGRDADPAGDP